MRAGVFPVVVAVSAAIAAGGAVSAAKAANWLEKQFWMSGPRYDHDVPLCDEHGALDRIMARFETREGRFWNSALRIVGFDNIREIAWQPWNSDTIPRRFCTASVMVSDGRRHTINYSIIEDGGLIGADYGVEWCVTGLDRNWAYNPSCKAAQP